MMLALRRYPTARIGIERKSTTDMQTLFRWRCDCGRVGVWLERSAQALLNGTTHEDHDHTSCEQGAAEEIYS